MSTTVHPLIAEIAPEEEYTIEGKKIIVRRDDLAFRPPLPPNAKMAALFELVKHAYAMGYKKVVMFAKKQQGTSYAIGLPVFCKMFDLHAIITYPQPKAQWHITPDFIAQARVNGFADDTELIPLHPNMVSINVNQSRQIAEKQNAYFIPFGFESALSVDAHANKFALPSYHIGTLITATMTGMILAGTLRQIYERKYDVERVYGVSCGRPVKSVLKSMQKFLDWEREVKRHLTIFEYPRNFHPAFQPGQAPFPLHPDYEAVAWYWLLQNVSTLPEPIYFINVGR